MTRQFRWIYLPEIGFLIILLAFVHFLKLNSPLFLNLNQVSLYTGEWIWANITILGDGLIASVMALILIYKYPKLVWTVLLAFLISTLIIHTLKPMFDIPRPPAVFDRKTIHIIGKAYSRHAFPSGHTTSVFTVAGIFLIQLRFIWKRTLFLLLALIVGFSRIAVGVHWPEDVLAGAAIGLFSVSIADFFINKLKTGRNKPAQLAIGALLLIASLILMISYQTHYPEAIYLQKTMGLFILFFGFREYWKVIRMPAKHTESALQKNPDETCNVIG